MVAPPGAEAELDARAAETGSAAESATVPHASPTLQVSPGPPNGRAAATMHHFSVDVEEYFQVSAFEAHVPRAHWERLESRVDRGMDRLLELLERHQAKATFFVLGWVAERRPQLVARVAASGHEVASHGWGHERITKLAPAEFRDSVRRSKELLETLAGSPVLGYRAPSFSILRGMEWALDILIEEGYVYDSSLFPVQRNGYGYAGGPRCPYWLLRPGGRLLELPPATLRAYGRNVPAGGGGYFRLLPFALTRAALRDQQRRGLPGMFYIHPWELDPDQPRVTGLPWRTRLRHYGGIAGTEHRIERLLSEFRFGAVRDDLALTAARAVVPAR